MTNEQFRDITIQYEKLIYTICYQMTRNSHTAEDLTQETFLSAYTHKESCPEDYTKQWLARIATNKAKDFLKSAYNRRVYLDAGETGLEVVSQEPLPERLVETDTDTEHIRGLVNTLKEPYLKVCTLYFFEEYSTEEIADALQRPKKTVETQLYRAKQKLQTLIKEDSDGTFS